MKLECFLSILLLNWYDTYFFPLFTGCPCICRGHSNATKYQIWNCRKVLFIIRLMPSTDIQSNLIILNMGLTLRCFGTVFYFRHFNLSTIAHTCMFIWIWGEFELKFIYLKFSTYCRPIVLSIDADSAFEANFVLATLAESQSLNGNCTNHTTQQRFQSHSARWAFKWLKKYVTLYTILFQFFFILKDCILFFSNQKQFSISPFTLPRVEKIVVPMMFWKLVDLKNNQYIKRSFTNCDFFFSSSVRSHAKRGRLQRDLSHRNHSNHNSNYHRYL